MSAGLGRGSALVMVAAITGCSPTGPWNDDSGSDATADAIVETGADARDVNLDGPMTWALCGIAGVGCDPNRSDACPTGQRCSITAFLPQTTAMCVTAGNLAVGQACNPRSAACAAGLQCVGGRCVSLCCGESDDASCAAAIGSPSSRCAGQTEAAGVYACLLPGVCDYNPQSGCAAGEYCFPQSALGEAICASTGSAPALAACQSQNECVAGLTCITPVGVLFGMCEHICNPRHSNCTTGSCSQMSERPDDFGTCSQ